MLLLVHLIKVTKVTFHVCSDFFSGFGLHKSTFTCSVLYLFLYCQSVLIVKKIVPNSLK